MISKYIEPWVLVPGFFILLIFVLALLLIRIGRPAGTLATHPAERKRVGRTGWTLLAASVIMYLLSIPLVSDRIRFALERSTPPAPVAALRSADAVVILGGGVIADTPSEGLLHRIAGASDGDAAALAPEAESRLLYGFRLATALDLPIVVSGGRVFADPAVPPEAAVAGDLLLHLGFPPDRLGLEEESRTTAENARRTAEQFPYRTVVVVTSAYHMRRALQAFRAAGLDPLAGSGALSG